MGLFEKRNGNDTENMFGQGIGKPDWKTIFNLEMDHFQEMLNQ